VVAISVLALWYVYMMPTSDVRTRIYLLVAMEPVTPLFILGVALLVFGLLAVWISGWWNKWSILGAVTGAAIGVTLFWFRALGLYVWLYDEQVTVAGQLGRALLALAVPTIVILMARRHGFNQVAA